MRRVRNIRRLKLSEVKKVILRYREFKDYNDLILLLVTFDGLLVSLIIRLMTRNKMFQNEEPQELYHIMVVALMKCILEKDNIPEAKMLPAWVLAYAKAAIRKVYYYKLKRKEISMNPVVVQRYIQSKKYVNLEQSEMLVEDILCSSKLSPDEREIVRRRFINGETEESISKDYGITRPGMAKRIHRMMAKLKRFVVKEGFSDEKN